jgi:hypothetical protein
MPPRDTGTYRERPNAYPEGLSPRIVSGMLKKMLDSLDRSITAHSRATETTPGDALWLRDRMSALIEGIDRPEGTLTYPEVSERYNEIHESLAETLAKMQNESARAIASDRYGN